MTSEEARAIRQRALEMMKAAGIVLTSEEAAKIEIADMGLGRLSEEDGGADPQHHRDPPAGIAAERLGEHQRRDQQRRHECGRERDRGALRDPAA